MTLLTHPKFIKKRCEIEQSTFDELYRALEQYINMTSSLVQLSENKIAIQAFHDLGNLIHLSKNQTTDLNERVEHVNLISATVKLINIILAQCIIVDDK